MVFYMGQGRDPEYFQTEEIGLSDSHYGGIVAVSGLSDYDALTGFGYRSKGKFDDFDEALTLVKEWRERGAHAVVWSKQDEPPYYAMVKLGFTSL